MVWKTTRPGGLPWRNYLTLDERREIAEIEREVVLFLREAADKEHRLRNLQSSGLKDNLLASLATNAA